ncbi:hypothetical protein Mapa_001531 [Marchantia paleacea]|nr:hypothetical protein Mapa_001531 [Marchantia paleacea]
MSSDSGIRRAEAEAEYAPPLQQQSSCRKKKADVNEGFVKDVMDHINEFVHASYDEHKTCLTKTVRKLFGGMSKIGQNPPASVPAPVVSVLSLRANTSSD